MAAQQLAAPAFDSPKELVAWMGAMQAQDADMARWAVGIRLRSGSAIDVDGALQRGEILRTHVMRPTWHLIAAEDIRWMLGLCAGRIRAIVASYGRNLGIGEPLYLQANRHIERILAGRSLTKEELSRELSRAGVIADAQQASCLIFRAETDGIVCSGPYKGRKATYALLEERVPAVRALHHEEALERLARNYFRSHCPASPADFSWWSGLSLTQARHAMGLIAEELREEKFGEWKLFMHESCTDGAEPCRIPSGEKTAGDECLHLLPSFDEYLISYKDRTAALDPPHRPLAFTNNGIFYPVILHGGKVAGNWRRRLEKGQLRMEASFFDPAHPADPALLRRAEERYRAFLGRD